MIEGIKPNHKRIERGLKQSLMLVTALTPEIGYEKATQIAQLAHKNEISLREANIQLGFISEVEFDRIVNPYLMTGPR